MSEQSLAALAHANDIRLTQAAWRRDLQGQSRGDGCRMVASELRAGFSGPVERLKLMRVLTAIRRMGPYRAVELMDRSGLIRGKLNRPVSDLTVGQRESLARTLARAAR